MFICENPRERGDSKYGFQPDTGISGHSVLDRGTIYDMKMNCCSFQQMLQHHVSCFCVNDNHR